MLIGMSISLPSSMITLVQRIKSLFTSVSPNGHMWLPGVGTNNGFSANNYLDSAGTTVASTDGLCGLGLDAAGSVGSELAPALDGTWTRDATVSNVGSTMVATNLPIGSNGFYKSIGASGAGKTFKVDVTISSYTSGNVTAWLGGQQTVIANPSKASVGVLSFYVTATGAANGFLIVGSATSAGTFAVSSVSVKEITGIHASQATVGSKPYERRGIVNLLLGSSSPIVRIVTPIAAPYTLAMIGTGSVTVSGGYVGTLTGTGASDLVVMNFTPSAIATTFTPAGSVTSFGLFQGTLTAQQILNYGGIPLTTTAAASSTLGPQYWGFDGIDDRLTLSAVPFQMSDDHCVVVAALSNVTKSNNLIFDTRHPTNATICGRISLQSGGKVHAQWRDDAGVNVELISPSVVTGSNFVASVWKVGNAKYLRVNGVTVSTSSTVQGAASATAATIGSDGATVVFFNGNIYDVQAHKITATEADVITMESYAARCAGGRLVNGAFVSDF